MLELQCDVARKDVQLPPLPCPLTQPGWLKQGTSYRPTGVPRCNIFRRYYPLGYLVGSNQRDQGQAEFGSTGSQPRLLSAVGRQAGSGGTCWWPLTSHQWRATREPRNRREPPKTPTLAGRAWGGLSTSVEAPAGGQTHQHLYAHVRLQHLAST